MNPALKPNQSNPNQPRYIQHIYPGLATSDGDGVKLTRLIGQPNLPDLDPFLMFDAFGTDRPQDYIGGFPPHPHRGFETVTYLLAGRMRHHDSAGNQGVIEPGGIQWMTAGRGIIHSEMPEQQDGLLMGFQLWVNLPSHLKMQPPRYQEFAPDAVPLETWPNGTRIKVVAGQTLLGTQGVIDNPIINPTYLDVNLNAGTPLIQPFSESANAFIYVHEGAINVEEAGALKTVNAQELAVLSAGQSVTIHSLSDSARFLLIGGEPLNQPVVKGGPFVMNTQEEIKQAFEDYRLNRF
jgi:hypothetical protein